MIGLAVAAVLLLVLLLIGTVRHRRATPVDRSVDSRDMTAGHPGWGSAMLSEVGSIDTRMARWSFAAGCVWASLVAPRRGAGRALMYVVAAAAMACVAMVAVSLLRYPGLRTGVGTWAAVAAFLLVLIGYVLSAAVISRDAIASSAVRLGLAGGLGLAVIWLSIGVVATYAPEQSVGKWLLLAAPALSLTVGAAAAGRGARSETVRQTTLLCSLVGGLTLFLAWVGDTLVTDGRPYDPGLLRDFASSGSRDLATYAVSDNLGAAMGLLLMVPVVSTALGWIGAATRRRVRSARSGS